MHDLDVLLLVVAADIVGLPDLTFRHHFVQGTSVVFDIEPVAYLVTFAVHR
ncbi:hypothetical protein D3C84_1141180 [compost metagenome]